MKLVQHTFLIILEVVITFGFLTIFFFNYVSKVEEEQVKTQIDNVVIELTSKIKNIISLLPIESQGVIREKMIGVITEKLEGLKPSQPSTKNPIVKRTGIMYMGIFFIAITMLSLIMSAMSVQYSWQDIVHYAILAVVVAAIVEFLFLRFIATRYSTLDGSTILNMLGKELEK